MGGIYIEFRLLAELLAHGQKPVSTAELGILWGVSQQSASRHIRAMEERGLIARKLASQGQQLSLTEQGWSTLREEKGRLEGLLDRKTPALAGKVASGLGEGAFYVKVYSSRIAKALGFTPYPGTLNLQVREEDARRFLSPLRKVTVDGFSTSQRTYGAVHCYPLSIQRRVHGAALVPDRTAHKRDTLELIAPVFLRKALNLKDGQTVEVSP